eukprot:TRINITY_DN23306_c0_g1_i1.p2 TRINITY_DN23306_c0_g1~~TRINITY_DN23306_c0_g1_i1.p2  ORF type:complete len:125 (+),score=26.38 TRINITY_DN23306_c0_g1_i1:36-410(+)
MLRGIRSVAPRAFARTAVITVKDEEHFDELLKNNPKVVVDFSAQWCGPCKMVGPAFNKLSDEITGVTFLNVDIDNVEELGMRYAVSSIPYFLTMQNGNQVSSVVGANIDNKGGVRDAVEALEKL